MTSSAWNTSLVHLLLARERDHAERVYLRQPRNGHWHELTWRQVMHQARQVAHFLQNLGLKPGAHVAIFSKNCAEWFITDFGIALAGMVNVPLFFNQHEDSIKYVLEHGEVKAVFVGKLDTPQQVRDYLPQGITTIGFDYHPNLLVDHRWHEVLAVEPLKDVVLPKPDDLYTIIYSSGTSGTPKGAMYTHEAMANYLAIFPADLRRVGDVDYHHFISYLPLAHVYERSAIQLGSVAVDSDVSFTKPVLLYLEKIFASNLQATLASVPFMKQSVMDNFLMALNIICLFFLNIPQLFLTIFPHLLRYA